MGARGIIPRQDVTQEIVLSTLPEPPASIEADSVATEAFLKLADMLSKVTAITEPMLIQMTNYALLESVKTSAIEEIKANGSTCVDGRGRLSQNPMYPVYFSALREQRAILRDLGLLAPASGKKKQVNVFTQFVEDEE